MWRIQLVRLDYDDRERAAADAVIESGWLTMGERVIEFETRFASMLGGDGVACLATANCTAALHMAVLAAGVGPGDEVIVPALTFVADANVVRIAGATPVFADSASPSDLTVDPDDVARRITGRTRAVIVVHYAGYPCDMDAIVEVCRRHGVALIEDVAHAPGATHRGRPLGTIGDVGCFSFFSNKNLSIGEGGMVSFRDPEIGQRLRHLRSHGMSTQTLDRHAGRAWTYDVVQPGLNYRMDEVHAALGTVQLAKLPEGNRRRGALTARYRSRLAGTGIDVPFADRAAGESAFHIMPVLLPAGTDRQRVMERLKRDGIQSSIHYPPFWAFAAYASQARPEDAPVVAAVAPRELTLPLYPTLDDDGVDAVVESLLHAVEDAAR